VFTPVAAFALSADMVGVFLFAKRDSGLTGIRTLNHASDLGGRYDASTMELRTRDVLSAAFEMGDGSSHHGQRCGGRPLAFPLIRKSD
jgi:hypothetical protein